MAEYNANNERIKRQYFTYLKEAKRQSDPSVDAVAQALDRFESHNKYRDFRVFHREQAVAFKRHLAEQTSAVTGRKLNKATLKATLSSLTRFFQWLAGQPGYKSRLKYTDADYFNLGENDMRIAAAHRERPFPTLEQVKYVIEHMPVRTEIERRDRSVVAFTLLTGARDSAIASMKLKHVDLGAGSVYQDAREVNTKFRKTFTTYLFPIGDGIRSIVEEWVNYLLREKLWGNEDPLFPATQVAVSDEHRFQVMGLARKHWSNATAIRTIFRNAFEAAGLPYFNPHSLRNTLVHLGERVCRTPEEFKAWSQNLGHEAVMTTFRSYGAVGTRRQGEIIRSLATMKDTGSTNQEDLAKAIAREFAKLQRGEGKT